MGYAKWIIAAAAALALGVLTLPRFLTSAPSAAIAGAEWTDGKSAQSCKSEGPANLDIILKDMHNADYKMADLKGKVVLVNFWAAYCAPCLYEIPEFIKVREAYHDRGFEVLGISTEDSPEALRDFAAKYRTNYPLVQVNAEVEDAYGPVFGLPTSILVGRDGAMCKRYYGPLSKEKLENDLKSLL